jgi:hypothetical protein
MRDIDPPAPRGTERVLLKKLFMKRTIFYMIAAITLLSAGCKKDEVRTVLHAPAAITGFSVSSNQMVLSSANDSVTVTSFSWQAVNYSYSSVVTYSLLFDVPSDTSGTSGWSNAVKVVISSDSLRKSFLGMDLNRMLNQMGLDPGVASTIVVRLKSDVNQSNGTVSTVPSLYSDLSITATPYKAKVIYPKLYVAGDFLSPSWTPKDQPGWVLACVNNDGVFEGYVNFPNAGNSFKLTSEPDWNGINYGWGTSGTTMSKTGGNLWTSGPGYCRVIADTTNLTISYTATQWVIAGDFNSWNLSATPMTFDPNTNLWTATGVSMTVGDKFKFEGNNQWTMEMGWDAKNNLVFKGGNIIAAKTGTFTVTLDLSQGAGNYAFSAK